MKYEQTVISDKDILGGIPVFTGTRVPIRSLIDHLKAGDTIEEFLEGFPSVTREQVEDYLEIAQASLLKEAGYAHPVR